jgi:hypothetical protein
MMPPTTYGRDSLPSWHETLLHSLLEQQKKCFKHVAIALIVRGFSIPLDGPFGSNVCM